MKFEELLKKIEESTAKIESGKVGIDESIELYEQAMKDCKQCYDILNTAKGKIEILNKEFCEDASAKKAEPEPTICQDNCESEE